MHNDNIYTIKYAIFRLSENCKMSSTCMDLNHAEKVREMTILVSFPFD